ncbi:MAG: flagellar basal body rod protein FlgB, partial [Proteobacteria bacterium]|nr:flagellar basal body rod protein FlgB [Pseudomonadota bacterium]
MNSIFGVHEQALALKSQRLQVLAKNIANADTPGFKARDVDFKQVLAAQA